jgi:hypothetical protein
MVCPHWSGLSARWAPEGRGCFDVPDGAGCSQRGPPVRSISNVMHRIPVITIMFALSHSVQAQQPSTTEPPLEYLRGPAFPTSEHGPAWPKAFPSAPTEPGTTGTIRTNSNVVEPTETKSHPKHLATERRRSSKHHSFRRHSRHSSLQLP